MNTYIVFDLEWNQSAGGRETAIKELPFEIIEIGAVKLNENREVIDTFRRLIRPAVYKTLHFKVLEVVNIGQEELRKDGISFRKAGREFVNWCFDPDEEGNYRENPTFCTWGEADLPQLQRNLDFYRIKAGFPYPLLYYDVQKMYSLETTGQKKTPMPLDKVVELMNITQDEEFHRALSDARYTAEVFAKLDLEKVGAYYSLDTHRIPGTREEEIYLEFPDYSKYVSAAFDQKEDMLADKTVTDMVCLKCRRMLKKRVRWFSANQKQYHCIAYCPEHGFVKGKIRVKHTSDERVYAVKTIKLVGEDVARSYAIRREEIAKLKASKASRKRS